VLTRSRIGSVLRIVGKISGLIKLFSLSANQRSQPALLGHALLRKSSLWSISLKESVR
jgi:hypothetical protein